MSFIGDSFGKLSKTGLGDLLFSRPGSNERIMPRQVVLSSKCFVTFKIDETNEYMAEFDQFSKTKRISEKKNFKPYGFTQNISLINDNGWELTFSGKKTDPKLGSIVQLQEYLLLGNNYSGYGDQWKASAVKLSFDIQEMITYLPDEKGQPTAIEVYTYKDCSLISYSEETPSDNQVATFNMALFCPRRALRTTKDANENVADNAYADGNFSAQVYNMIDKILKNNKQ